MRPHPVARAAVAASIFSAYAFASDEQSTPKTITALLGTPINGAAASVVGVAADETTLAVACASTDTGVCSIPASTVTITQAPNKHIVAFGMSFAGVSGYFTESCELFGPENAASSAVCHEGISLSSAGGGSTTVAAVATVRGSLLRYNALAVTAGGELLRGD